MKPSLRAAILLTLVSVVLSGCINAMLTQRIVDAPNRHELPYVLRKPELLIKRDRTYAQAWRLPVGPPAAELAVAVIEPGNYHFRYTIEWRELESKRMWPVSKPSWTVPVRPPASPQPAKGTVLLLHGYADAKENMLHWGLYLAEAGYRAVLVDLRGHGRSTGEWIGYGAFEVRDLMQVLDDLQAKGLVAGKVGVVGVSYGGSMGLLLAARDARVATVVALEANSDPKRAVEEMARANVPDLVQNWSHEDFVAALARAAKIARFSWSDGDVLAAVQHTSAPLLFYHGAKDQMISPEHSRILSAHAGGLSKLVILENDEHILLSMRLDPIAADVVTWLDEKLATSPAVSAGKSAAGAFDSAALP